MSQPKNEVVTEIEGGLLLQLDGRITDKNGNEVKPEAAQEGVKAPSEPAKPEPPIVAPKGK